MRRPARQTRWLPALAIVVACSDASQRAAVESAAAESTRVQPNAVVSSDTLGAQLTAANVRALSWIVGTWKGTGDVETPFYERYDFTDDSTLRVLAFADSTVAVANDTTVFALRAGRFGNHDKSTRWVARVATADRIEFAPVNARNAFTWRKLGAESWEAVISFPASGERPAGERHYTMTGLNR